MYKKKRNDIDKLKTLFFGKDLRVTEGDAYTEVRKYDFSSYYPEENYIKKQGKPRKNVVDIGNTVQMFKIQIMHLLSIKLLKKHLKSAVWSLLTGEIMLPQP